MVKNYFFFFFFLCFAFNSFAGPEIGWHGRKIGNFESRISNKTMLCFDKFYVLLCLSEKLANQKLPKNENFSLYFQQDFDFPDSSFLALGYGGTRDNWEPERKGIKLIIRDRDFDIKKVLNVINSACENIEQIKSEQNSTQLKTALDYSLTIKSISPEKVSQYSESKHLLVENLLKERVYRKDVTDYVIDECTSGMDFYFQNDSFHLFNLSQENRYKHFNDKKDSLNILLGAKNITEYIRYNQFEHFVFVNDSQFYSFNSDYGRHYGPVTIPGFNSTRGFIKSIHTQDEPFRAFYFFIQKRDKINKVLFIPDSNLVISNYDKIEQHFVSDYLRKGKEVNSKVNNSIVLLSLLLGSILLNVIFILRKKSSDI